MIDWKGFCHRMRAFGPGTQILNSPCSQARIDEDELRLGQMPDELSGMLRAFNGAELFINAIPMITVFGLSTREDTADSDWFIDRYTPKWRAASDRSFDWVIGMTNYGSLIILDQHLQVQEWDTLHNKWGTETQSFSNWLERIVSEGVTYLKET